MTHPKVSGRKKKEIKIKKMKWSMKHQKMEQGDLIAHNQYTTLGLVLTAKEIKCLPKIKMPSKFFGSAFLLSRESTFSSAEDCEVFS